MGVRVISGDTVWHGDLDPLAHMRCQEMGPNPTPKTTLGSSHSVGHAALAQSICFTGNSQTFGLKRTRIGLCRTRPHGAHCMQKLRVLSTAIGFAGLGRKRRMCAKHNFCKQFSDIRTEADSNRTLSDSHSWRRLCAKTVRFGYSDRTRSEHSDSIGLGAVCALTISNNQVFHFSGLSPFRAL